MKTWQTILIVAVAVIAVVMLYKFFVAPRRENQTVIVEEDPYITDYPWYNPFGFGYPVYYGGGGGWGGGRRHHSYRGGGGSHRGSHGGRGGRH